MQRLLAIIMCILLAMELSDRTAPTISAPAGSKWERVVATVAGGFVAFVEVKPSLVDGTYWPADQLQAATAIFSQAIEQGYAGPDGFGSLEKWAEAFGLSRVPPGCPGETCTNAGGALRVVYIYGIRPQAGWFALPDGSTVPAVKMGHLWPANVTAAMAYHELAHIWDLHVDGDLGTQLDAAMQVERDADGAVILDRYYGQTTGTWTAPAGPASGRPPVQDHGEFPSNHINRQDARVPAGAEHFAETAMAYFQMLHGQGVDFPVCWTDEDPRCPPGQRYAFDRGDFMRDLLQGEPQGGTWMTPEPSG